MHRSLILYIPAYPLSYQVDGPVQVRGAPAGQQRGRRLHPPRLGHRHLRPRVGHGQLGHRGMRHLQNYELFCTGWMEWMSHRKWRETKQQPIMLPGPAVPGCCLVSFCFPCDIHCIHSVGVGNFNIYYIWHPWEYSIVMFRQRREWYLSDWRGFQKVRLRNF